MKDKKYYSLVVQETSANIYIYGDIVSWEWLESDVSSYTLAKEIEGLPDDIETINVYINSYGGEVAEALAICNSLARHKAKVITYCDGFACSAAADIFMIGDERIMSTASLLMIHNAWMLAAGDHNDLHKSADDLKTINDATVTLYMERVNITEEELRAMMDEETWIGATDALEMGFATSISTWTEKQAANQSMRVRIAEMILERQAEQKEKNPPKSPEEQLLETLIGMNQEQVKQVIDAILGRKPNKEDGGGDDPPEPPEDPPKENKLKKFIAAMMTAERSD